MKHCYSSYYFVLSYDKLSSTYLLKTQIVSLEEIQSARVGPGLSYGNNDTLIGVCNYKNEYTHFLKVDTHMLRVVGSSSVLANTWLASEIDPWIISSSLKQLWFI